LITNKGRLYYIDPWVEWSLCKTFAAQIYGEPYAIAIAKTMMAARNEYYSGAKVEKIKIRKVPKKHINEQFFLENVVQDEKVFIRCYQIKIEQDQKIRKQKKKEREYAEALGIVTPKKERKQSKNKRPGRPPKKLKEQEEKEDNNAKGDI